MDDRTVNDRTSDERLAGHGEIASLMQRILYEVKRVVVGQDHFL